MDALEPAVAASVRDVPQTIEVGGATLYFIGYDPATKEALYAKAESVSMLSDDDPSLCEAVSNWPIDMRDILTVGKQETISWYYYSLTVWWTFDYCDTSVATVISESAQTDTLCYEGTAVGSAQP
ncbi:MAG: hypothetical protein K0R39_571 [Symbiobacteriaceae bacterium]|jgi:hypothetical protein|nr:hypothetical protein [Symbiobacteriaceae bacterium]